MARLRFSSLLALHWSVAFLAMAVAALRGAQFGVSPDALGVVSARGTEAGAMDLVLAGCFLFTAVLFAWTCVEHFRAATPDQAVDPIFAYGAATLSLTVLVAASVATPGSHSLLFVTAQFVATIVSYAVSRGAATHWELPLASNDNFRSARFMARGAAYESRLARISGRNHGSGAPG